MIFNTIFRYLNNYSLKMSSCVCRNWEKILRSDSVLRYRLRRYVRAQRRLRKQIFLDLFIVSRQRRYKEIFSRINTRKARSSESNLQAILEELMTINRRIKMKKRKREPSLEAAKKVMRF